MEKHFMIIFSLVLLLYDVYIIRKTKRTIDTRTSLVQGFYLAIIFILWILYCLYHLDIL